MKEMSLATLIAIFEEMLGIWLWIGLAGIALAVLLFLATLLRERTLHPRRLVVAEFGAVAGGVLAILIVQQVTNSGFRDIGGPIDWVLGVAIFAVGALATLLGAYGLVGILGRRAARD